MSLQAQFSSSAADTCAAEFKIGSFHVRRGRGCHLSLKPLATCQVCLEFHSAIPKTHSIHLQAPKHKEKQDGRAGRQEHPAPEGGKESYYARSVSQKLIT